jgi:hypothetical protein
MCFSGDAGDSQHRHVTCAASSAVEQCAQADTGPAVEHEGTAGAPPRLIEQQLDRLDFASAIDQPEARAM